MTVSTLTFKTVSILCLAVYLPFLQGCNASREHKWLFYDLQSENDVQYRGYKTTREVKEHTVKDGTVRGYINKLKLPDDEDMIALDKPAVHEDNQIHFVFFGPSLYLDPRTAFCTFTETSYAQPHDGKMAPPFSPRKAETALLEANNYVNKSQALVDEATKKKQEFEAEASKAEKKLQKKPRSRELSRLAEEARNKIREAEDERQNAMIEVSKAENLRAQLQKATARAVLVCDLDTREKGGKQFVNDLKVQQADKTEKVLFKDTILVHELYRFRVLAGPVFSTLQKRNKSYSLKTNSLGQSEVTASPASTSPANFALMLKTYLFAKRDLLDPPSLFSSRWYEMINPVIGINLFDNPLENLYAGLSLELAGGFDIVGGVHWAKTQQLTGGFFPGQITTQSGVATKEQFSNGWFVGVAADLGIITTWLKSAGSGLVTAIKTNP